MSDYEAIFDQLEQVIAGLSPDQRAEMRQLARQAKLRRETLQAALDDCRDSMDDLRLRLKYFAFDQEATQREKRTDI